MFTKCSHMASNMNRTMRRYLVRFGYTRSAVLNWRCEHPEGVREGTSWGASFSSLTIDISDDNTKNITSNGARGAKMIFPSGRGAGFKMN